jgi:hypothetical protein
MVYQPGEKRRQKLAKQIGGRTVEGRELLLVHRKLKKSFLEEVLEEEVKLIQCKKLICQGFTNLLILLKEMPNKLRVYCALYHKST